MAALCGAAIAAISCSRAAMEEDFLLPEEEARNEVAADNGTLVHFRAIQTQTKAQFGEEEGTGVRPTLWTSNDSEVKLSLNYGSAVAAEVTPSADFRSATFDATFDFTGLAGPFTFYSVSPASAAQALSPSREAWKVTIPCEQTPSATSVDEAGIILASTSASYTSATAVGDVDLYFNHLTAYGRMSLGNFSLADGETVQAVELTATTPIVGDWYWHTSGSTITDYGASSTLTIHTALTSDIWFACAPVSVDNEMMSVTVITTAGSYEQLVEFPAGASFEAGRAAVFTVDMDGAEFTAASGSGTPSGDFTLVTDASVLQAGDEIIITNVDATYGLGPANTSGSTPYRQAVTVSATGNVLTNTGTATVLTLRAGNTSGTWALDTGNGYLVTTSTKNSLSTAASISDASSWSVSIVGEQADIQAQSGTYYRLLYNYNSGTPRFSAYGSSSTLAKPAIYRRGGGGASTSADPMLTHSDYGCYLGTGLTRTLVDGDDQVTRAYNVNGILTYTIIDPATVEELEISGYSRGLVKGDAVTVTVNWRRGTASVLSDTYTMKVIKEKGPKVWLGNGTGNGFIIKK